MSVFSRVNNDLFQNATQIAEGMVKTFGMSDKVGFRAHGDFKRLEFGSSGSEYGPSTNELIDNEVKRLLQVNLFR